MLYNYRKVLQYILLYYIKNIYIGIMLYHTFQYIDYNILLY